MKKLLFLTAIVTTVLGACQTKTEKAKVEKDSYEKAKESLEEREKKNPVEFISVTSKDKHNLIGQTVVKGTVHNNAKICQYKDVELELNFYSKTGVLLQKENETIYDIIEPGKSVEFKKKFFVNKDSDSMYIKITSAKVN